MVVTNLTMATNTRGEGVMTIDLIALFGVPNEAVFDYYSPIRQVTQYPQFHNILVGRMGPLVLQHHLPNPGNVE